MEWAGHMMSGRVLRVTLYSIFSVLDEVYQNRAEIAIDPQNCRVPASTRVKHWCGEIAYSRSVSALSCWESYAYWE
jgi:hypothetical protein